MKQSLRILLLVLGMVTLMPGICFPAIADSTVLGRIWSYQRNFSHPVDGLEQNVYMRYGFNTIRRNPILFLVPTMYVIAQGDRDYIAESYCKVRFHDISDFRLKRQVVCGNIPRQRTAMPAILQSITPDFYNITIYPDYLLSPFHKSNRHFYKYDITQEVGGLAFLHFRPRTINTQLISGHAVVNAATGRLQSVQFEGEFDMITFKVSALMNLKDMHTPLPERCTTNASFRFLGNHITSHCTAVYNCPTTLPDSLDEKVDRRLMAQLRPLPLTADEQAIYYQQDEERRQELARRQADTTALEKDWDWVKEVGWDIIGDNLVNGNKTTTGPLTMRFSPLLNPLYFGSSPSSGISYKLKLGAQYTWNAHRYLLLEPRFGYNFKKSQFFYSVPLRMTYNPKRNGYAEIMVGNGNRISNATMADDFRKRIGIDSTKRAMPEFKDLFIQAVNNVQAYDWLEIKAGLVYHRRIATNRSAMTQVGMKDEFRSFAPLLTLRFTPWRSGPVFTVNYEHAFKSIFKSDLDYERWEYDASYLHHLKSMRILNLRAGLGYYTRRSTNYFVDFANFHANNLPTGWEDDWSGQFQLLNTRWYNESRYYFRGHISYESPMIMLYRLPLVGRYIEAERIYLSALNIEHTRPYFEAGYGLSNRYLSGAVFANFLNANIQEIGFKVTLQLFNRW